MRLELTFVSVDELSSWYRASDVLVYPYRQATTSGALMTGISYGKPIVATTIPSMTELLHHGENALLVDYGNVGALSAALIQLISDDQLRRRLAERSQALWATVPRWPAIARQTRQCYEQVAARRIAANAGRPSLRAVIRDAAAAVLHKTGGNRLLGALAGSGDAAVVLAYHRVVDDFASEAKRSIPAMLISRAMLERHLHTMMRRYRFVSLDDLARYRESGERFEKPAAAVTFDDGYSDFYSTAFPLLQKLGIPAAVFVVTGLVGTRHAMTHDRLYDRLVRAFSIWRCPSRELARVLRGLDIGVVHAEQIGALAISPLAAMRALYVTFPEAVTHRIVEALAATTGVEDAVPEDRRPLSWEMLREMQDAGVTIGSHTRHHPILTNEPQQTVRDEIAGSKDDLERTLGDAPQHFAYPGGYFRTDTVRTVAAAGYRAAYTTCLHRDAAYASLTIPRKLLWEKSCLDARGDFSPAVMNCRVTWSFDLFRGCDQNHG